MGVSKRIVGVKVGRVGWNKVMNYFFTSEYGFWNIQLLCGQIQVIGERACQDNI